MRYEDKVTIVDNDKSIKYFNIMQKPNDTLKKDRKCSKKYNTR